VIDSHCHLDDKRFDADRDAVIDRALAAGIETMVSIGTGDGPPDLEAAIRIADRYAPVLATAGVHPHDAAKATDSTLAELEAVLKHPKVIALGEIGLDYHYDFSPRDRQKAVFQDQLALARAARRPIVIHTREAWEDTFSMLDERWAPAGLGGIMHCFTGGPREAEISLRLGFHISFSGIVTYPKSVEIQEAAKFVPLDRILIETDAPYLAPAPHRGKRNEPAFVAETARKLAGLHGVSVQEIITKTTANWKRLFAAGAVK
jgi:TatD DNase family protein